MFIGHLATGLAARALAPRVPLPLLLAAPMVLDLVWPVLVATGVERAHIEPGFLPASPLVLEHYPYSHSMVAALGWAALTALVYLALGRGDRRGALVVGALVVGHWLLDVASHSPDVPVGLDGPKIGLGLWGSVPGTLAVELAMWWLAAAVYARATRATGRWGSVGLWTLVAVLSVAFVGGTIGPPPPDLTPLLVMIPVMTVVIVGWSWAVDRARPARA
jgi:hypothetical protein